MRKFFFAVITFFTVTLLSFRTHGDWIKFENQNCKLLFPVTPVNDSTPVETAVGKLIMYTHTFEADENTTDSNLVYSLIETQYPEKFFQNTKDAAFLKGFFTGAIEGAVKNVNGKLLSEKDIKLGNVPGKEIKIDYANGVAVITVRLYLDNTRMYAMQTIALAGKENNLNAAKFHNSFEIK